MKQDNINVGYLHFLNAGFGEVGVTVQPVLFATPDELVTHQNCLDVIQTAAAETRNNAGILEI